MYSKDPSTGKGIPRRHLRIEWLKELWKWLLNMEDEVWFKSK